MSADKLERRRLADLASCIAEADYIAAHGRNAYLAGAPAGAMLRNAGERVLIKVATVVERLTDSFKDSHPEVDWVAISRMRNLVAHHYDKVNDDLMWVALTARIPGSPRCSTFPD